MLESNFYLSQASWHLESSSFGDCVERKGSLEGGERWFPFRERVGSLARAGKHKNLLPHLMKSTLQIQEGNGCGDCTREEEEEDNRER